MLPDFTTHDSNVYIPLPPEYVSDVDQTCFNSDHLVKNNYGKELIIKYVHIKQSSIVNGRTGSDNKVGSFTCYTPQGCSVVDYFVVSQNFMEFVSDMSVHNLTEHSDHCPISLDISILKMTKQSKTMANTRMEGKDRHVNHCYSYRVKWDDKIQQRISEHLKSLERDIKCTNVQLRLQ